MIYDEESDYDLDPKTAVSQNRKRPWPVRMVTILLFVEAIGFFAAFLYSLYGFNSAYLTSIQTLFTHWMNSFPQELVFLLLAILALLAGISFVALWRTGWTIAMLAQGITLAVAIGFYLRGYRFFTYAMIICANILVIYLHHPDIQTLFRMKKVLPLSEEGV